MISRICLLAFLLTVGQLFGCAPNPYTKFYYDQSGGKDVLTMPQVVPPEPNAKPLLFQGGGDKNNDYIAMFENGYTNIGYSSFNGSNVNTDLALKQAIKVHASAIVLYSQYRNTVSGVMPLTLPNTQISTTNMNGTAYGSGGFGTFNGHATTTTTGTQTTYIPYNVDRYDYGATYWIKIKPPIFGVRYQDLNADTRAKLESNKGVEVIAVVKNSPEYKADIFRGDILRKVGAQDIYDSKSFSDSLERYKGQLVEVEIFRNGKTLNKEIELDSPTY